MKKLLPIVVAILASKANSQPESASLHIVPTPTQAVISYTAPTTGPCTIQEGTDPTFATVDHDVNPALFPGSNQDTSRPGTVSDGLHRTIVLGFRGTATASDGKIYSRALENATTHYVKITCDGNSWSEKFETQNPPMGNTSPDYLPFNKNGFGNYGWPTINYTAATSNPAANYLIDPLTGYRLQRWTGPGDGGDLVTDWGAWGGVIDLAGTWTTPQNILGSSGYASYSGAGGPANALYLWGPSGLYRPTFLSIEYFAMDDLQTQLSAYASAAGATQTVCLVYDGGIGSAASDCLGKQITTPIPRKKATRLTPPDPWPRPILGGWGSPDVTNDMLSNTFGGTLESVSGTGVTWGSNSNSGQNVYFPVTVLKAGMRIGIAGTDPACPQNICTIASITDERHLSTVQNNSGWTALFTTTTSAVGPGAETIKVAATNGFLLIPWMHNGNYYSITIDKGGNAETIDCKGITGNSLTRCTGVKKSHPSGAAIGENYYTFPNFGIKLWVNPNGGTVFLQNAQNNWAISNQFFTEYQGAGTTGCDGQDHAVTYAADGQTPLEKPTTGHYCTFVDGFGNDYLFLMIPSTGESRKLSNLNNGARLGYAYDTSNGYIENCTYNDNPRNPAHQKYAAWNDNRGNNNTQNPAISCNYLQEKKTIQQEIAAAYPQIDFSYFGHPALQHSAYPFLKFMMRPQQGSMTWFCDLDVSQPVGASQVQYCHNSWDTYPSRWAGVHGFEYWIVSPHSGKYADGWSNEYSIGTLDAAGSTGFERWDVQISKIYNNGGSTALTPSFTDPQSCAELGVTDPRWVAQGATGKNCIQMDVLDPVSTKAGPQDLRPLGSFPVGSKPGPWPHNASSCGGDGATSHCWSYLQPIAPGDNLVDYGVNGVREAFGVGAVKPISGSADATEHIVLWRKYNPFGDCAASGQAHAAGFTLTEMLPAVCYGGGFILYPDGKIGNGKVDNPDLNAGHIIQWNLPGTDTFILSAPYAWSFPPNDGGYGAGYGVRLGQIPEIWGHGANYGVQDNFPFDQSYRGLGIGIIQSHAGGLTYHCATCKWILDGRPLGGAGGGVNTLWKHTYKKVSGTNNIYMLDLPEGQNTSLDLKRQVVRMWAGQHLIQNVSGPHSHLDDAVPWQGCIALLADECVAGSQPDQIYEVVPAATLSEGCEIDMTINTPCAAPMAPEVAGYTQHDISASDPTGLRGRVLTYAFGGPGRTNNYANMHALSTGDWGVTAVVWGDGRRSDVWGVRLTPVPAPDEIKRNTWISIPISVLGVANSTVRIRYGYAEYGLDANHQPLFCNPNRLEDCTTAASATSGVLANKSTHGNATSSTTSSALGTKISVASSLSVKSLGRECLSGNSRAHTLQLLDSSLHVLASVKVNMAGCTPSKFVNGALSPALKLASGQYYLMSSEMNGGDSFYSQASTITPTNGQVAVLGATYDYQGKYGNAGGNGTSYGPVTMSYAAAGDPFAWESEPQSWKPCSSSCTVTMNAYAGRVLYYVIDRMVNGTVTSSGLNVQTVP